MARILCPALIGRDAERAQLDVMLDAARRGRGGVVFVSGPPGIGKSRLIADLVSTARGVGVTVLSGRCVPARIPVPYRPFAEALMATPPTAAMLNSHEMGGFRAALAWIVPAWREDASPARVESPVMLAEALLRTMQAMARSTGLCPRRRGPPVGGSRDAARGGVPGGSRIHIGRSVRLHAAR